MKYKLNETNSVWNYFGILSDVAKHGDMVVITSEDGAQRQMSIRKYKLSAESVFAKCKSLIDKEVEVRTSQATRTWNTDKWFSDIKEFS